MASTNRPKKYKKKLKFKLKKDTLQSIFALLFIGLGGLTLLSFIGQSSGVNNTLQSGINLSVGWTAFLVPIVLISLGLALSRIRLGIAGLNIFIGLFVVTIALSALFHPISSLFSDLPSLARAEAGIGGGILGYTIFSGMAEFITPLGAWFVLVLVFLGGWLIMLNTNLANIFEASATVANGSKKAVEGVGALTKRKEKGGEQLGYVVNDAMARPITPVATPKPAASPLNSTQVLANEAGENVIWEYPSLELLPETNSKGEPGDTKKIAATIEGTLDSFGIRANVREVNLGPTVTQYALQLTAGTKTSKITSLSQDLALAVSAKSGAVRIEAPIPGKDMIGIEIPNQKSAVVGLRAILESKEAKDIESRLILPLGLGANGLPMVADLAKMPHLLVAGSTGSGKSVAINTFITSLLFYNSPSELKLILVDPKFVELTGYNGIPHLLTPVLTENDKVVSALKWATAEMDRRYKKLAEVGARNISGYNEMSGFQALPYIVIIIDELSDLMMTAPAEVEDAIVRIAQKARAVGIHLILATQRPSSDIITGLIKANIPARIAFNVASNVDSRVIIDQPGAEKLLGKGDMLYMPPDASKPFRIQGSMIADPEIAKLLNAVKSQGVVPEYSEEVVTQATAISVGGGAGGGGDRDPLFEEAVRTVCNSDKASASLLQRRLKIGYARAARILDEMEAAGIVAPGEGSKPRDVLISDPSQFFGAASAE